MIETIATRRIRGWREMLTSGTETSAVEESRVLGNGIEIKVVDEYKNIQHSTRYEPVGMYFDKPAAPKPNTYDHDIDRVIITASRNKKPVQIVLDGVPASRLCVSTMFSYCEDGVMSETMVFADDSHLTPAPLRKYNKMHFGRGIKPSGWHLDYHSQVRAGILESVVRELDRHLFR
jgi:hypothetical protein